MAAYNKRHYLLIFDIVPALYLKQSKRRAVLKYLIDSTNHPFTNNDDASNVVQPSQSGKLNAEPLINKEIAAVKLNRNATLLEAFTKYLVYKSTIIYSLGDNVCQNKLATILEEDSKEEKDNNIAKLKDNTFNTPTALKEYINLAVKVVKEGEDRLYFQVVNPVASLTKKEVAELLNHNFIM